MEDLRCGPFVIDAVFAFVRFSSPWSESVADPALVRHMQAVLRCVVVGGTSIFEIRVMNM